MFPDVCRGDRTTFHAKNVSTNEGNYNHQCKTAAGFHYLREVIPVLQTPFSGKILWFLEDVLLMSRASQQAVDAKSTWSASIIRCTKNVDLIKWPDNTKLDSMDAAKKKMMTTTTMIWCWWLAVMMMMIEVVVLTMVMIMEMMVIIVMLW